MTRSHLLQLLPDGAPLNILVFESLQNDRDGPGRVAPQKLKDLVRVLAIDACNGLWAQHKPAVAS